MGRAWRLGLIPLAGDTATAHTQAFADALAAVIGGTCEVHRAADYRALVAGLNQRLVDFAWLPPLSAARAVRAGSIVPAAIVVRSGATSYMTGLVARKGGKVKVPADLRGVRVAWVDRESASGYVVIRAALSQLGLSLASAFSEELFLRSHAEVARAVHTGRVDVGATCFNFVPDSAQIARGYAGESGLPLSEVQMIAHAGPIPSDIFAVHKDVPPLVLAAVQRELAHPERAAGKQARALMHADDFGVPTLAHMEMLESLYEDVLAPRSNPNRRSVGPTR